MDKIDLEHLKFVEVPDHRYAVFKHKYMIYFIHVDHVEIAKHKVRHAAKQGFSSNMQLMYLSTFVFDQKKYEMVKNRYPDQELPRQVFDSLFSGVLKDVIEL